MDESEIDYYEDVCYECGGYGDDYYYNPVTDEWESACPNCPFNSSRYDDDEYWDD